MKNQHKFKLTKCAIQNSLRKKIKIKRVFLLFTYIVKMNHSDQSQKRMQLKKIGWTNFLSETKVLNETMVLGDPNLFHCRLMYVSPSAVSINWSSLVNSKTLTKLGNFFYCKKSNKVLNFIHHLCEKWFLTLDFSFADH